MSKKSKKNTYTSENPYNVYAHGGLTDNFPMLLMQKNNNAYPANPGKPMNMGQFYPYGGMYSNPTLYQASNGYKPGSFAGGGFFDGVANYGRSMADIGLSTLGMPNVVRDDSYTGNSAQDFRNIAGTVGGITKMALPLAATAVGGPMAGMAVGAGQMALGQVDKGLNQQPQQYPLGGEMMAYGKGGIHIKPENRGKFTAYKKRTGKTTAEALHSKDPHVRKMANFARNAAKWKHADGGFQPQEFYNNWSKDQIIQMNAPYTYAMGGVQPGMANAQIEKQEVVRYPDGGTDQANAPTHANGGLDVNLPGNTQIFSDRLKSTSGKTFAKEAEKFKNNKWDKILNDKDNHDSLRTKTAEMMKAKNQKNLDAIFAEQESQKQMKAKKAFGKFMAKHGGQIPMFYGGGINSPVDLRAEQLQGNPFGFTTNTPMDPSMSGYTTNLMVNNQGNQESMQGIKNSFSTNSIPNQPQVDPNNPFGTQPNTQSNNQPYTFNKAAGYGNTIPFDYNPNQQQGNQQGQPFDKNAAMMAGAAGLVNSVGPLSYLLGKDKGVTKQAYYNNDPKYMDPSAALYAADRSAYGIQRAIPGASGGHGGNAMNALLESGINRDQNKNKIIFDYANANAGIFNNANSQNIVNKYATDDTNMRRLDQSLNRKYQATYNLGNNAAGAFKTYNEFAGNDFDRNMMKDYAGDFYIDRNGNKVFKKSNS